MVWHRCCQLFLLNSELVHSFFSSGFSLFFWTTFEIFWMNGKNNASIGLNQRAHVKYIECISMYAFSLKNMNLNCTKKKPRMKWIKKNRKHFPHLRLHVDMCWLNHICLIDALCTPHKKSLHIFQTEANRTHTHGNAYILYLSDLLCANPRSVWQCCILQSFKGTLMHCSTV